MRPRIVVYTSCTIAAVVLVVWLWWRDILIYLLAAILFVILFVPLTGALTFPAAFLYHLARSRNLRRATHAAAAATKATCHAVLNAI